MKEANRLTAAITAEAMATPLVMALVVLPTASRSAMIWRALRSPSSMSCQAISPMPLALSEMGPKESMATLLPVWLSMPMPIMATRVQHVERICVAAVQQQGEDEADAR